MTPKSFAVEALSHAPLGGVHSISQTPSFFLWEGATLQYGRGGSTWPQHQYCNANMQTSSGVTKVDVTRCGNWWCHPIFS